jgi:curli biogenesis system outer membrane secretion channel CsgG
MLTSMKVLGYSVLAMLLLSFAPAVAHAARPTLAIAPFVHNTPNVRLGLAAAMAQELAGAGHFDVVTGETVTAALMQAGFTGKPGSSPGLDAPNLAGLAGVADYLLVTQVTAFTVAEKEPTFELGRKLSDLGQRTGLGARLAQVGLDFRLIRVNDGAEILALSVEGLESRHGVAINNVSQGWLSTTKYETDEFRRTNLGRAFYKAIGQALYELYAEFPLEGTVLAIAGDSVIIDLDQRAGVQIGDEIMLLRNNPITNTAGDPVWQEQQRVGSAKVIEFQPGKALCLVADGAGQIAEGDIARPLSERLVLPLEADREELP